MRNQPPIRGDYFVDKLFGFAEALLAAVSLGIVVFARLAKVVHPWDVFLGACFLLEIAGAVLMMGSKERAMWGAFSVFCFRVLLGIGYMGAVHGDKLARSTLGFPLVFAVYCWLRARALQARP